MDSENVYNQILQEVKQSHTTRKELFMKIESKLKIPIVSFFTSFVYPVMIDDSDADILEEILRGMDLSKGFALILSSPGGIALASERIIRICRSYSGTGKYKVIVPAKAKSAATVICFGAEEIIMDETSELGPVDPQITLPGKGGEKERFSLCNLVESYEALFNKAVKEKNNLEPYLQQLSHYDARAVKEYKLAIDLAKDIAIKALHSGMMSDKTEKEIEKKIKIFLTPKQTKTHGRAVYQENAKKFGLNIVDKEKSFWKDVYELYMRTNWCVSHNIAKCIESKNQSFIAQVSKN